MKILFDHDTPFQLAHGGLQTQIVATKRALERAGVCVDWLRWWEEEQPGDLIHFFCAAPVAYLEHAQRKGLATVKTSLLTSACDRSNFGLRWRGLAIQTILRAPFGEGIKQQLEWQAYHRCTVNVVGLEAERRVLEALYGVPRSRISVVPVGLSDVFLDAPQSDRSSGELVCVGSIVERKNSVALAHLAKRSEVPILFVGKPYSKTDPYWRAFERLVDGRWVRHLEHIDDEQKMVALLGTARGAVIMSQYENWCLAAHEAAACGLPVMLPRSQWALERFGARAAYFSGETAEDAKRLRAFYDRCAELPAPKIRLFSWDDVARDLIRVYQAALAGVG